MATTFTWTIRSMTCAPVENGKKDVVVTANWVCRGLDASTPLQLSAARVGTCQFTYAEGADFTPYPELTEQQVLGWCWNSGVDKAGIEAAVDAQIQAQAGQQLVISQPLPWAA